MTLAFLGHKGGLEQTQVPSTMSSTVLPITARACLYACTLGGKGQGGGLEGSSEQQPSVLGTGCISVAGGFP